MNFLKDFLAQIFGTCSLFYARDQAGFLKSVLLGLVLAVFFWFACSNYARLWNKKFRITKLHHWLCSLAALLTFGFTVLFFALAYMKETSEMRIQAWEQGRSDDQAWQSSVFRKQYEAVKQLDIEDFSSYPPPDKGGNHIPLSKEKSQLVSAKVIADEAASDFHQQHPFLGAILQAEKTISEEAVQKDTESYFRNEGHTYPNERGIKLSASRMRLGLDKQTPHVVYFSRFMILTLFFLMQGSLALWIGYLAFKDIKERT